MFRYFARRIIQSVFLILGVVFIVFFMIRINGDPVSLMISRDATMEQREAFRKAHGFDRPVSVQFADYLVRLSQGDLGNSLQYRLPASALIQQRLIPTFELAFSTLIFIAVFSISIGDFSWVISQYPI
ncbi:MAG UNVERIFIED_CONTAM: ABC transporter permease [Anaerolineae bacterium]|jgi:peptide/nickel transport system permease protein